MTAPIVHVNGALAYPAGTEATSTFDRGVSVTLAVQNAGSFASFAWVLRRAPSESAAAISSASGSSITLGPLDKASRYTLRCIGLDANGATVGATTVFVYARLPSGVRYMAEDEDLRSHAEAFRIEHQRTVDIVDTLVAPIVTGGDEDLGPILNTRIRAAAHPTNEFRVVDVPGRRNRWIATPIRIHDDTAGGNAAGVTLRNAGGAPDGTSAGEIRWNGANGGTAIEAWARGTVIEGITIRPGTGALAKAIDITWPSGAGARNLTKVTLRNVRIAGSGWTYGVVVGDLVNGVYPLNCDYLALEDVYFDGAGSATACLYIPNQSGQVKACRFVHCSFYGAQYGIRAFRAGYSTETCGFSALTVAAVYHDDACDMLRFTQTDSENCARFLDGGGVSGAYWPVTIDGGRFDCTQGLAANGRYISKRFAGPLNIVNGARFDCQANTNWHIYAATGAPGGTTVDTQGVLFPRRAADDHAGLVQGQMQWSRRACDVNGVGRLGDLVIT